jgi:hypothetical protein
MPACPQAAISEGGADVCVGMKAVLLAILAAAAQAQVPDVHEIIARVAANQAKTEDARREFLYHQKQTVRLRRADGKIAREEYREYNVTPTVRGIDRQLIAVQGRYRAKGEYTIYDELPKESDGIDAGLVDGFLEDLNDDRSRDGIANDLFPLTYHQQLKYRFALMGVENYRGHRVYRVVFEPRERYGWKGEALIDAEEYQPMFVSTKLGHGLPLAVKTLLGTDVRGLGFSVSYQKFAAGAWFPVSYGGEFELHVLFFYKRTIAISLVNADFERVDVQTQVRYSAEAQ